MHGHATKRIRLPIKQETLDRIHLERTVSDLGLGHVLHPSASEYFNPRGVKIRIFKAVPETDSSSRKVMLEIQLRLRREPDFPVSLVAEGPVPLDQLYPDHNIGALSGRVDQPCPDPGLHLTF